MDIKKLKSWTDWFEWKQDVTNLINIYGLEDLFEERKTKPTIGDEETQNAFDARLELWEDRQEQVVALVGSSLGFLARDEIKDMTTLSEVMDTLEAKFKPRGNAAFLYLCGKYRSLTLEGCDNVAEYAVKLLAARRELEQLDESCKIGEPYFIKKFLTGLGGNYRFFVIVFYQTHSLLPERESGKIIKHAVTFDEAVNAAKLQEQIQKQLGANVGLTSTHSRVVCQHCHKPGHQKEKCWVLRPELRAEAIKRRKRKLQTRIQQSANDEENAKALAFLLSMRTSGSHQDPINRYTCSY